MFSRPAATQKSRRTHLGCHRFLSQALKGEYIGREAIDDGIWNIIYYTKLLGRLDERAGRVTGASYRSEKCK